MSIEQKIAEILAESKKLDEFKSMGTEGGSNSTKQHEVHADDTPVRKSKNAIPAQGTTQNADNDRNDVKDQNDAEDATEKKNNPANSSAVSGDQAPVHKGSTSIKGVKEDVDALLNGEELSEEFRTKAETIFEAAVLSRVAAEVARIEEEFESKLAEQVEKNTEGLVEQVDGYLGYIAEQWMTQNEIALERGMKSDILEGFIGGLKNLFEEHYIDIPEEKFDVLGEMESKIDELEAKLNEQVAANIELSKTLAESNRAEIVKTVSEGLTDTETEKFMSLVEEISYEDQATFETKVKTIRENYFTTKATAVKSVVTDAPVEALTEEKKTTLDPVMSAYAAQLNKLNK